MKFKLITIFFLLPLMGLGQTVDYKINGIVQHENEAKYAYLFSESKPEIFMVSPISSSGFSFKGSYLPSVIFHKSAYIFLDSRSDVTVEEVRSKIKSQVWALGKIPSVKQIIVEDITLGIENQNQVNSAKIIAGGTFTQQDQERVAAKKAKYYKPFVLKYPDSPFSLSIVDGLVASLGLPLDLDDLESRLGGSAKELFPMLSERLKQSKEGIEIKRRMDLAYEARSKK